MIDLTNILDRHEDDHLEAKSAKGGFPDSFWESYSAFANSNGGVILLGVEESKDHTLYIQDGLPNAEKMKASFWKMVNNRQKISHNIVTNRMVYVAQLEGKDILVVEVPRVERTTRPVYKGLDPRLGTYRRWGEGDHLCSIEEVTAILRDASSAPLDAKPITNMDMSVFCEDSVNAYRNVFRNANPHHLWNQLDNEMFLRRIKAVAMGEDGQYHPTEAGLLMFGYEYEITSVFPNYFLDYQEDRLMVGVTRWKDRVTSQTGDWSGNLFDFTFKVLPKLQADLKVPFVLKGNQRMDDTPLHKVLREAMVNTLSNADYRGRRGVVITKNKKGFCFANPGNMRISKREAIDGGVSDPRNSTILKFFSLIRFGERAGSGLSGIMHVWRTVYHTEARISEIQEEVDRTVLILSFDGNDMDVKAMLKLYDESEDTVVAGCYNDLSGKVHKVLPDNEDLSGKVHEDSPYGLDLSGNRTEKLPDKVRLSGIIATKLSLSGKFSGNLLLTKSLIGKLTEIYIYISQHPHSTKEDIATYIERSEETSKKYLQKLTAINLITPEGGNKNRTYSIT